MLSAVPQLPVTRTQKVVVLGGETPNERLLVPTGFVVTPRALSYHWYDGPAPVAVTGSVVPVSGSREIFDWLRLIGYSATALRSWKHAFCHFVDLHERLNENVGRTITVRFNVMNDQVWASVRYTLWRLHPHFSGSKLSCTVLPRDCRRRNRRLLGAQVAAMKATRLIDGG